MERLRDVQLCQDRENSDPVGSAWPAEEFRKRDEGFFFVVE